MNEIKFRIWDTVLKEWWTKGSTLWQIFEDIQEDVLFKEIIWKILEDRLVFQQYTGLQDENGKEIYEGDIVKYYNELYIVRFGDNRSEESKWGNNIIKFVGFYLAPIREDSWQYYYTIYSLIDNWNDIRGVVIGNIYENPELLEAKNE